jgi:hypothetical protein
MKPGLAVYFIWPLVALAVVGCGGGETPAQSGSATPTGTGATSPETTPTKTENGQTEPGGEDGNAESGQTEPGGEDGNGGGGPSSSTSNEVVVGPALSRSPIEFGVVLVGSSGSLELTVRNGKFGGEVSRRILDITIDGDANTPGVQPSDFEVTGGDCAVNIDLPPSGTCSLEVTFRPKAAGIRNAYLTISVDSGFPGANILRGTGLRIVTVGPTVETEPVLTGE